MEKVKFIHINSNLPTYSSNYEGWFVVDRNNKFYIGISNGWKELTSEELYERVGVIEGKESSWDAKYDKPSDGIPKSDLASAVQTSLGLADSSVQNVKTINNTTMTGTGNVSLVSSIYMNNQSLTPATGTNVGRVTLGNVVQSIYMNGTTYNPSTSSTNRGLVDLGNIYSKSEIDNYVSSIESNITSSVSSEATLREQADTNLNNTKQNNINTLTGWTSSANQVLVNLGGSIQWKPFNNILAGSTTPISTDGNDGDIYIQTE